MQAHRYRPASASPYRAPGAALYGSTGRLSSLDRRGFRSPDRGGFIDRGISFTVNSLRESRQELASIANDIDEYLDEKEAAADAASSEKLHQLNPHGQRLSRSPSPSAKQRRLSPKFGTAWEFDNSATPPPQPTQHYPSYVSQPPFYVAPPPPPPPPPLPAPAEPLKNENERLRLEIKELNDSLNNQTKKLDQLAPLAKSLEQELAFNQDQADRLADTLDQRDQQIKQLGTDLQMAKRQTEEYRRQMDSLTRALKDKDVQLGAKNAELETARNEAAQQQADADCAREEAAELRSLNGVLRKECQELIGHMAKQQEETAGLRAQLQSLRSERDQLTSSLAAAVAERDRIKSSLLGIESSDSRSPAEVMVDDLRQELLLARQEAEQLRTRCAGLDEERACLQEAHDSLLGELAALRRALATFQETVAGENRAIEEENHRLARENQELKQRRSPRQSGEDGLGESDEELDNRLLSQLDELRHQNRQLTQENEHLRNRVGTTAQRLPSDFGAPSAVGAAASQAPSSLSRDLQDVQARLAESRDLLGRQQSLIDLLESSFDPPTHKQQRRRPAQSAGSPSGMASVAPTSPELPALRQEIARLRQLAAESQQRRPEVDDLLRRLLEDSRGKDEALRALSAQVEALSRRDNRQQPSMGASLLDEGLRDRLRDLLADWGRFQGDLAGQLRAESDDRRQAIRELDDRFRALADELEALRRKGSSGGASVAQSQTQTSWPKRPPDQLEQQQQHQQLASSNAGSSDDGLHERRPLTKKPESASQPKTIRDPLNSHRPPAEQPQLSAGGLSVAIGNAASAADAAAAAAPSVEDVQTQTSPALSPTFPQHLTGLLSHYSNAAYSEGPRLYDEVSDADSLLTDGQQRLHQPRQAITDSVESAEQSQQRGMWAKLRSANSGEEAVSLSRPIKDEEGENESLTGPRNKVPKLNLESDEESLELASPSGRAHLQTGQDKSQQFSGYPAEKAENTVSTRRAMPSRGQQTLPGDSEASDTEFGWFSRSNVSTLRRSELQVTKEHTRRQHELQNPRDGAPDHVEIFDDSQHGSAGDTARSWEPSRETDGRGERGVHQSTGRASDENSRKHREDGVSESSRDGIRDGTRSAHASQRSNYEQSSRSRLPEVRHKKGDQSERAIAMDRGPEGQRDDSEPLNRRATKQDGGLFEDPASANDHGRSGQFRDPRSGPSEAGYSSPDGSGQRSKDNNRNWPIGNEGIRIGRFDKSQHETEGFESQARQSEESLNASRKERLLENSLPMEAENSKAERNDGSQNKTATDLRRNKHSDGYAHPETSDRDELNKNSQPSNNSPIDATHNKGLYDDSKLASSRNASHDLRRYEDSKLASARHKSQDRGRYDDSQPASARDGSRDRRRWDDSHPTSARDGSRDRRRYEDSQPSSAREKSRDRRRFDDSQPTSARDGSRDRRRYDDSHPTSSRDGSRDRRRYDDSHYTSARDGSREKQRYDDSQPTSARKGSRDRRRYEDSQPSSAREESRDRRRYDDSQPASARERSRDRRRFDDSQPTCAREASRVPRHYDHSPESAREGSRDRRQYYDTQPASAREGSRDRRRYDDLQPTSARERSRDRRRYDDSQPASAREGIRDRRRYDDSQPTRARERSRDRRRYDHSPESARDRSRDQRRYHDSQPASAREGSQDRRRYDDSQHASARDGSRDRRRFDDSQPARSREASRRRDFQKSHSAKIRGPSHASPSDARGKTGDRLGDTFQAVGSPDSGSDGAADNSNLVSTRDGRSRQRAARPMSARNSYRTGGLDGVSRSPDAGGADVPHAARDGHGDNCIREDSNHTSYRDLKSPIAREKLPKFLDKSQHNPQDRGTQSRGKDGSKDLRLNTFKWGRQTRNGEGRLDRKGAVSELLSDQESRSDDGVFDVSKFPGGRDEDRDIIQPASAKDESRDHRSNDNSRSGKNTSPNRRPYGDSKTLGSRDSSRERRRFDVSRPESAREGSRDRRRYEDSQPTSARDGGRDRRRYEDSQPTSARDGSRDRRRYDDSQPASAREGSRDRRRYDDSQPTSLRDRSRDQRRYHDSRPESARDGSRDRRRYDDSQPTSARDGSRDRRRWDDSQPTSARDGSRDRRRYEDSQHASARDGSRDRRRFDDSQPASATEGSRDRRMYEASQPASARDGSRDRRMYEDSQPARAREFDSATATDRGRLQRYDRSQPVNSRDASLDQRHDESQPLSARDRRHAQINDESQPVKASDQSQDRHADDNFQSFNAEDGNRDAQQYSNAQSVFAGKRSPRDPPYDDSKPARDNRSDQRSRDSQPDGVRDRSLSRRSHDSQPVKSRDRSGDRHSGDDSHSYSSREGNLDRRQDCFSMLTHKSGRKDMPGQKSSGMREETSRDRYHENSRSSNLKGDSERDREHDYSHPSTDSEKLSNRRKNDSYATRPTSHGSKGGDTQRSSASDAASEGQHDDALPQSALGGSKKSGIKSHDAREGIQRRSKRLDSSQPEAEEDASRGEEYLDSYSHSTSRENRSGDRRAGSKELREGKEDRKTSQKLDTADRRQDHPGPVSSQQWCNNSRRDQSRSDSESAEEKRRSGSPVDRRGSRKLDSPRDSSRESESQQRKAGIDRRADRGGDRSRRSRDPEKSESDPDVADLSPSSEVTPPTKLKSGSEVLASTANSAQPGSSEQSGEEIAQVDTHQQQGKRRRSDREPQFGSDSARRRNRSPESDEEHSENSWEPDQTDQLADRKPIKSNLKPSSHAGSASSRASATPSTEVNAKCSMSKPSRSRSGGSASPARRTRWQDEEEPGVKAEGAAAQGERFVAHGEDSLDGRTSCNPNRLREQERGRESYQPDFISDEDSAASERAGVGARKGAAIETGKPRAALHRNSARVGGIESADEGSESDRAQANLADSTPMAHRSKDKRSSTDSKKSIQNDSKNLETEEAHAQRASSSVSNKIPTGPLTGNGATPSDQRNVQTRRSVDSGGDSEQSERSDKIPKSRVAPERLPKQNEKPTENSSIRAEKESPELQANELNPEFADVTHNAELIKTQHDTPENTQGSTVIELSVADIKALRAEEAAESYQQEFQRHSRELDVQDAHFDQQSARQVADHQAMPKPLIQLEEPTDSASSDRDETPAVAAGASEQPPRQARRRILEPGRIEDAQLEKESKMKNSGKEKESTRELGSSTSKAELSVKRTTDANQPSSSSSDLDAETNDRMRASTISGDSKKALSARRSGELPDAAKKDAVDDDQKAFTKDDAANTSTQVGKSGAPGKRSKLDNQTDAKNPQQTVANLQQMADILEKAASSRKQGGTNKAAESQDNESQELLDSGISSMPIEGVLQHVLGPSAEQHRVSEASSRPNSGIPVPVRLTQPRSTVSGGGEPRQYKQQEAVALASPPGQKTVAMLANNEQNFASSKIPRRVAEPHQQQSSLDASHARVKTGSGKDTDGPVAKDGEGFDQEDSKMEFRKGKPSDASLDLSIEMSPPPTVRKEVLSEPSTSGQEKKPKEELTSQQPSPQKVAIRSHDEVATMRAQKHSADKTLSEESLDEENRPPSWTLKESSSRKSSSESENSPNADGYVAGHQKRMVERTPDQASKGDQYVGSPDSKSSKKIDSQIMDSLEKHPSADRDASFSNETRPEVVKAGLDERQQSDEPVYSDSFAEDSMDGEQADSRPSKNSESSQLKTDIAPDSNEPDKDSAAKKPSAKTAADQGNDKFENQIRVVRASGSSEADVEPSDPSAAGEHKSSGQNLKGSPSYKRQPQQQQYVYSSGLSSSGTVSPNEVLSVKRSSERQPQPGVKPARGRSSSESELSQRQEPMFVRIAVNDRRKRDGVQLCRSVPNLSSVSGGGDDIASRQLEQLGTPPKQMSPPTESRDASETASMLTQSAPPIMNPEMQQQRLLQRDLRNTLSDLDDAEFEAFFTGVDQMVSQIQAEVPDPEDQLELATAIDGRIPDPGNNRLYSSDSEANDVCGTPSRAKILSSLRAARLNHKAAAAAAAMAEVHSSSPSASDADRGSGEGERQRPPRRRPPPHRSRSATSRSSDALGGESRRPNPLQRRKAQQLSTPKPPAPLPSQLPQFSVRVRPEYEGEPAEAGRRLPYPTADPTHDALMEAAKQRMAKINREGRPAGEATSSEDDDTLKDDEERKKSNDRVAESGDDRTDTDISSSVLSDKAVEQVEAQRPAEASESQAAKSQQATSVLLPDRPRVVSGKSSVRSTVPPMSTAAPPTESRQLRLPRRVGPDGFLSDSSIFSDDDNLQRRRLAARAGRIHLLALESSFETLYDPSLQRSDGLSVGQDSSRDFRLSSSSASETDAAGERRTRQQPLADLLEAAEAPSGCSGGVSSSPSASDAEILRDMELRSSKRQLLELQETR